MVILAAHDVGQPLEIEDNGSIPILSIQPDHRLAQRNRLGFHIRADRLDGLEQFSTVGA